MADRKTVVLATRAGLGFTAAGDENFGLVMADKFFDTLAAQPRRPQAICFYTEGVRLVCEGSQTLPALRRLESAGVRLVACKTCLDYYELSDRVRVGEIGGMKDIVALVLDADSVVTI